MLSDRESSIELLKILAIILIIISHVTQTLSSKNLYITYQDYVLNLSIATINIQYIILIIFRYFGAWGNSIFLICSVWFLLKSPGFDKKKWFFMLTEVWIISIIIFIIHMLVWGGRREQIALKIIIKIFFPTVFSNNWYITCFIIFYPFHPVLNYVVRNMKKKSLFRITIVGLIINFGFDFIWEKLFFPSTIILWTAIYFAIAYLQKYLKDFQQNINYNLVLLVLGLSGLIGLILVTNFLGLYISFFKDKVQYWAVNRNPLIFVISISMFNLTRSIHFKNYFINYISKLSLLIYIIHENIIVRTYYRPCIINYIYRNYGYNNVVLWVLMLTVTTFILSCLAATIYKQVLQKLVLKISYVLYKCCRKIYLSIESYAMGFH